MKALRLVAAAASIAAATAHAQDSVAVYGVADVYTQYVDGASRLVRLQSGGLSSSRFGVRGQEDLGDGFYALFTLESGINFDDGTNAQNAFWGRQAFVGLRSKAWGQLTLGRQYSALYFVATEFSEFSNVSDGPTTAVIGGFGGYEPTRGAADSAAGNGGPARVNNSVRYETPEWAGLRGGVLAGLGETAGGTRDNRLIELWGRYTAGPLGVMLSVIDDKGGAANALAARTTTSLGVSYVDGTLRMLGGYLDVRDRGPAHQGGAGWWLGADWTFAPSQRLKAQYVQSRPKALDDAKTQALGVGWEYLFSKRTTLYVTLTRYQNQDHAGLGRASFAIPAGVTTASHNDVTEAVSGMRFVF